MSVFLFGSQNNVGTDDFTAAGNVGSCQYAYAGADAIIEELHIILRVNSMNSGSLKLAVYDHNVDRPGNLLVQGTIAGSPNAAAEYILSGLSLPIVSGVTYHIACTGLGGSLTFTGPAGAYLEKSGAGGNFPNPYGAIGSPGSFLIPMWAAGSLGLPAPVQPRRDFETPRIGPY